MGVHIRRNSLTSQRVEVALVYKEMLGPEEARAYLTRENVPEAICERILANGQRRNDPELSSCLPPMAPVVPYAICRRRNHLHDAIVEAAVKIEKKLGRDWALALLHDEKVPKHVAERVLAAGPRQLRAKKRSS